jgi:hypothetical protein
MLLDCYGLFHDNVIGLGCLVLIARVSELSIGTHVDKGDCDQFCSTISAFFLRNLEKNPKIFTSYYTKTVCYILGSIILTCSE